MTENLEILQEAKKQYEQDLETVKEMIRILVVNGILIKIKFQTDYKPLKFKIEDVEYTALYREDYRESDGDTLFEISRENKIPPQIGREITIGKINVTNRTFKSWHLKEFAKVLKTYKDLMEEDFVTSAKEYLA